MTAGVGVEQKVEQYCPPVVKLWWWMARLVCRNTSSLPGMFRRGGGEGVISGAPSQWAQTLCFTCMLFSLYQTTFHGRVSDPFLKNRVLRLRESLSTWMVWNEMFTERDRMFPYAQMLP